MINTHLQSTNHVTPPDQCYCNARSSDSEAELRFYLLDGTAFYISVFATRPTTAGRRERSCVYTFWTTLINAVAF